MDPYLAWVAVVVSAPLFQIMAVCILCGMFGGIVAHFINNEKRSAREDTREAETWFEYPSHLQSGAIGSAGAVAFLFFIIAVGGLTNFQTLTEQLRSIAVSVIAGFGARSLLPRMVGHLEKQVDEVRTKAQLATDEAEKAKLEAETARSQAQKAETEAQEANSRAAETEDRLHAMEDSLNRTNAELQVQSLNAKLIEAAQPAASPQFWQDIFGRAQDLIRSGGAPSMIWINAARVLRYHDRIDEAVALLDRTLAAFEAGRLAKDQNYANAFFNRACYRELRHRIARNPTDRSGALSDIDLYLRNVDEPASEAKQMTLDPDLADLVKDAAFASLVGLYQTPE